MISGIAKGESVEKAKDIAKDYLVKENMCVPYWETDKKAVSRLSDDDVCIVASCY